MNQSDINLEQHLLNLGVTRTVYSFYFPEVKTTVERLWKEKPHFLYEKAYLRSDDESLQSQFAQAWLDWVRPVTQIDVSAFRYFYPCAGSSEAIRDTIAEIGTRGGRIHVFRGEYEGYRAYARAFKVEVMDHERSSYTTSLLESRPGDCFFLSQPSSIDGNLWSGLDEFLEFSETHCPDLRVAVDLCYVGTAAQLPKIDLSSPAIHTVFFSLSKVFGVYFHRIGGVFSKSECLSLVGNQYFQNRFSLYLGRKLLTEYGMFDLPRKYLQRRDQIVASLTSSLGPLKGSDALMLATGECGTNLSPLQSYVQRHQALRVCLTPALDGYVHQ